MAFDNTELDTLFEITGHDAVYLEVPIANLSEEGESSIRDDILTWSGLRNKYIPFQSGGATVDPERLRNIIRQRVRNRLNLNRSGTPSVRTTTVF